MIKITKNRTITVKKMIRGSFKKRTRSFERRLTQHEIEFNR
jgi:hypothetical protein